MTALTNRDLVYPKAFKWYKDSYTRSGHYKYFKYPSPASEDPNNDANNLDNFRTPYKYSIHNVRKGTILNEENEYFAYLEFEAVTQTTEQRLIKFNLLKSSDAKDPAKIQAACDKFKSLYGSDPAVNYVSTNIENLECLSLLDKKATSATKRDTIRSMFAAGMEEERQAALVDRYTRLEDHYESKQLSYFSWDLTADLPEYRQLRIDAIIFNEEHVISPRAEAGKIKVFAANPRKNWQVLDNSFDSDNRMLAQSQVKDARAVAIGLPDDQDASLSQQRRRQLVEDSEDEADKYIPLPVRTKYID